ncbi:MAG: CapA family protein [Acidobacteriia bacterium]|nr:CapA family protein [Terriglobia bacterium]
MTLLTLFFAFSLVKWCPSPAAAQAAARVSYPRELSRVTFAAAGDVIPHQPVVQSAAAHSLPATPAPPAAASDAPAPVAKDSAAAPSATPGNHAGWDVLFAAVADIFRQADFGFVNLETPVAPKHSRGSKPFQFDAPIALLQALKFSGIKIVSFANNHVFDQGHLGFAESLGHLREQDLLFTGAGATADAAWKPVILEKNGIKVGWLGMTRWLNGGHNPEKDGDPHVAFFPYPGEANGAPGLTDAQVLEAVKAARAQCDFLLISIHWGVEYATAPRNDDVEMAHKMLEAGAGAVLGHHPHVLQPIETYLTQDQRHTVILYSLGNFLSNQSRNYVQGLTPERAGEQRDSLIVTFSVIKKDYGPAGIRFELGDMGILPVWTENNHLLARAGHDKTLLIRPVLMDREIPRLQARFDELDHLGPQLTPAQKQELVQVSRQLQLLKRRRELLLARTSDDYLVAPPNP